MSALFLGSILLQVSACASPDISGQDETPSYSGPLTAARGGDGRPASGNPAGVISDPCYPPPHVLSFAATPAAIAVGESATLAWSVQVPNGCPYTIALLGQSVGPQGSVTVQPVFDTTYTLTLVWGPNRTLSTTAQAAVPVSLPRDPLDPTRSLVTIADPPSLDLFLRGVSTPDTTVVVESAVNLDLSGFERIPIAGGVRLVGGRTAVPGRPFNSGPRLFTTTRPSPLFAVQGKGARITGMRIQGRLGLDDIADGDGDSSIGISVAYSSWGPTPIEIDHNEITGWSNAGVEVRGDDSVQGPPVAPSFDAGAGLLLYGGAPEPAYIHDNFIHDNLHTGKLGYGIVLGGKGAHASIERNVFDFNRHAISGDGSDFSGYRAYLNLVLAGGGYDTWIPFLETWHYTHQFDMHGQDSYCLGAFADRDCGTAGHDIDIQFNSFLYTNGTAVKIRGTPQLAAVVRSNVFAHDSIGDAVDHTEGGVVVGDDNQVEVTATGIDACDFDGDGLSDTFLTTGRTWWFQSGRRLGPWIYLRTSSLQVRDVILGDVDGDSLCDVTADGVVYSGGTRVAKQTDRPSPIRAGRFLSQ